MARSLSLTWTTCRLFREFSKKTTFLPISELKLASFSVPRRLFQLPLAAAGLLFTGFITAIAIKKIDELLGA